MGIALTKQALDVGLVVHDADEALAFYRDDLGLDSEGTMEMPDGGLMHRLPCGASVLKLIVPPHRLVEAAPGGVGGAYGYRCITLWVDGLDEVVERCRTHGRTVAVEPWEFRPRVWVAIVEDPDGNWVELVQTV